MPMMDKSRRRKGRRKGELFLPRGASLQKIGECRAEPIDDTRDQLMLFGRPSYADLICMVGSRVGEVRWKVSDSNSQAFHT